MNTVEAVRALVEAVDKDVKELQGEVERSCETLEMIRLAIQGEDPLGGGSLAMRLRDIEATANGANELALLTKRAVDELRLELQTAEKKRSDAAEAERAAAKSGRTQVLVALIAAFGAVLCALLSLVKGHTP